MADFDYITAL